MRENWTEGTLGDFCEVITKGTTPTSIGYKFTEEGVNFVKVESLTDNGKFITTKFAQIDEDCHESLKRSQLKEGDILFSIAGALGRTAIVTANILPANTNQALSIIRLKKDAPIQKDFLIAALTSGYTLEQIEKHKGGVAQQNLSLAQVKSFNIPIPPLQEQQQIVAILDEAFSSIDQAKANIEKNIQNAKELFQAKLNEIFTTNAKGWEQKRFQDIAIEFGRGKSKHRPRNDAKLFGGDYPFVQTGDVRNVAKFITKFSQTYNEVGLAQSRLWTKGTICITIAANIAETAILDIEACFPDSIIGLIVDESKANRDYCFYALQYLKTELQAKGKGSAQDNINLGTFQTQFFPFPVIKTQEKMVKILDDLKDKCILIEDGYKLKLENFDDLKKSILQKAFSGELTNKSVLA